MITVVGLAGLVGEPLVYECIRTIAERGVQDDYQIAVTSPLQISGTNDSGAQILNAIGGLAVLRNNKLTIGLYMPGGSTKFLREDGTWVVPTGGGAGTVTSVDASGGSTGLSFSGGPITISGTLTLGGLLATANGGTNKATWTAGSIPYLSTATQFAEDNARLFWDATNHRLGVRTAAPAATLEVSGSAGSSLAQSLPGISSRGNLSGNDLEFGAASSGCGSNLGHLVGSSSPFLAFQAEQGTTSNTFRTRGFYGRILTTDATGSLLIGRTASSNADNQTFTEDMRISGQGLVGIGTTGPNELLDVRGKMRAGDDSHNNYPTDSPVFYFSTALTNVVGNWTATSTGGNGAQFTMRADGRGLGGKMMSPDWLGLIGFRGKDDVGFAASSSARILAAATETWSSTAHGTRLEFWTTPNTTTSVAQAVVIDHNGYVGIGTATPGAKLAVSAGSIVLDSTNSIYLNGSASGALDTNWYFGKDSSHNINIAGGALGTRAFQVIDPTAGNAVRFHAEFSGNVGIGTPTPGRLLDVGASGVGIARASMQDTGGAVFNVMAYGATPNTTGVDQTPFFAAALSAASTAGAGSIVWVPAGAYRFTGGTPATPTTRITIPAGVTLAGAFGGDNVGSWPELQVIDGQGTTVGLPFCQLGAGSVISGFKITYPNQAAVAPPIAFPFAIALDPYSLVQYIHLYNAYQGLDAATGAGFGNVSAFRIHHISGQPLLLGISIDQCADYAYLEHVHFWEFTHQFQAWQLANATAIQIARADGLTMNDIQVWNYQTGIKLLSSTGTLTGGAYGNWSNIQLENVSTGIDITAINTAGLNISGLGIGLIAGAGHAIWGRVTTGGALSSTAALSVSGMRIWGGGATPVLWDNDGPLEIANSQFVQWSSGYAVDAAHGNVTVTGCYFRDLYAGTYVNPTTKFRAQATCARAIFTSNIIAGGTTSFLNASFVNANNLT